ncbi:hypothetical protein HPB47_016156 [Ixodes persulcatus]|uniref:Uncharacterized protein n=1 Tax=Ixodes persulcatus TaxID=34615 RepID=A0AC60QU53_IXOPE|nr:hypothetical protein HPB47_016156 [Ixodes persulcatus]
MESEDGEYEVVQGKKRRKTSKSEASSSKDGANLQVGCTVLFTPTENHKVDSLSKLKLTDYLNNAAPTMVTVVRINKVRNIVAVDVKRPAFKAELLKLNKLCTARETEVTRYKLEHNTTFREAKEAIHARRQTSKKASTKGKHQQNTSTKAVPPATDEEFPPLENRNTTTTLDDAATVTQEEKKGPEEILAHGPPRGRPEVPKVRRKV